MVSDSNFHSERSRSCRASTWYVYHGARDNEERDGSGTLQGTYVYGNYIDEVLTLRRGTADYYHHSDDQWNTVALTDDAGDVVERYEYGDYGLPRWAGDLGCNIWSACFH